MTNINLKIIRKSRYFLSQYCEWKCRARLSLSPINNMAKLKLLAKNINHFSYRGPCYNNLESYFYFTINNWYYSWNCIKYGILCGTIPKILHICNFRNPDGWRVSTPYIHKLCKFLMENKSYDKIWDWEQRTKYQT